MSATDDRPADVCLECATGVSSAPAPACPQCTTADDRLVEWDRVLRAFVCGVCSHQWRPRLVAAIDRPAPAAGGAAPLVSQE